METCDICCKQDADENMIKHNFKEHVCIICRDCETELIITKNLIK